MTHEEIIHRFLSLSLARFVRNVESEFRWYAYDSAVARPGCLKRDRVRAKLTNRAYNRYAATL